MIDTLKMPLRKKAPQLTTIPITLERAGWIPPEIRHNWDIDPYAYQTEEELMPAGGLHGELLGYMMEVLRDALKKRGLRLLLDVFMLYRDSNQIKQRISPDLLLMPYVQQPPRSYDLDDRAPPLCVAEVTSPKSRLSDLEKKAPFYLSLGIPTYLAIDAITASGRRRRQIELHVWRDIGGQPQKMQPDSEGAYTLPEMGLKIIALGQQLTFLDAATGEKLFDVTELLDLLEGERQAREWAESRARRAEARLLFESEARQLAETQAEKAEARAEKARVQAQKAKARAEKVQAEAEKAEARAEKARVQAQKAKARAEKVRVQAQKADARAEKAEAEIESMKSEQQQKTIQMAQAMLQEGLDLALIAKITGLAVDELSSLDDE